MPEGHFNHYLRDFTFFSFCFKKGHFGHFFKILFKKPYFMKLVLGFVNKVNEMLCFGTKLKKDDQESI